MSECKISCWASSARRPRWTPWSRLADGEDVTWLWFNPTTVPADAFGRCATAVVETIFRERLPAPADAELARLNRRACFGSFFTEDGRLGIRATYCIYDRRSRRPVGRYRASAGHGRATRTRIRDCSIRAAARHHRRKSGQPRVWKTMGETTGPTGVRDNCRSIQEGSCRDPRPAWLGAGGPARWRLSLSSV